MGGTLISWMADTISSLGLIVLHAERFEPLIEPTIVLVIVTALLALAQVARNTAWFLVAAGWFTIVIGAALAVFGPV